MIIRESTRRAREPRRVFAMALYKTHKRHAGLSTHATCGATSQPCQATCDAVSSVCPAHVLTDLGWFDIVDDGDDGKTLVLKEIAPGVTVDEVRERTTAAFEVSSDLRTIAL